MQKEKSSVGSLLSRVRQIEIKARRLSQEQFAGSYKTAFKGRGIAFSEVREYRYGDDLRDIDWNVTARYDEPFIKVFEEERELTVLLLIDMSASVHFGTYQETKRTLLAEIAATLAFSAIENKDKVGVILFTNRVEKYIPPAKGRRHILYIIREILFFKPEANGTDPASSLVFLNRVLKKRATVFMLSDFSTYGDTSKYQHALRMAAIKHDIAAIVVRDRREEGLTPMGLVYFEDPETGRKQWVNTDSRSVRKTYEEAYIVARDRRRKALEQYGIDYVEVATGEDFATALLKLFAKR